MSDGPSNEPPAGASLRAQLLASEHWALLAARGTTQSEILVRVGLLLTVLSAALVTTGLLATPIGFGRTLAAVAFAIFGFVWLVGLLTLLRVLNASEDDAVFVLAMNRLRAGYVQLDPGLEAFLVQSSNDDFAGMNRTYSYAPRPVARQLLAGLTVFALLVCLVLTGVVVWAGLTALGAAPGAAAGIAAAAAVVFVLVTGALEGRRLRRSLRQWTPIRPSPLP